MQVTIDRDLSEYIARRLEALELVQTLLISSVDLQCAPEDIDPDAALFGTGLGLDSLDAAEVMIGIEVELGIRLDGREKQIVALRSVNALVDLILREKGLLP